MMCEKDEEIRGELPGGIENMISVSMDSASLFAATKGHNAPWLLQGPPISAVGSGRA